MRMCGQNVDYSRFMNNNYHQRIDDLVDELDDQEEARRAAIRVS